MTAFLIPTFSSFEQECLQWVSSSCPTITFEKQILRFLVSEGHGYKGILSQCGLYPESHSYLRAIMRSEWDIGRWQEAVVGWDVRRGWDKVKLFACRIDMNLWEPEGQAVVGRVTALKDAQVPTPRELCRCDQTQGSWDETMILDYLGGPNVVSGSF